MSKEAKKLEATVKPAKVSLDGTYPSLSGLSFSIGYLEQLLATVSEPLLIGGAVIAYVDFQTNGSLLTIPAIMYIWAFTQAIAIDACFIVTWRKAIKAGRLHYYGQAIFLGIIGIVLGVVSWAALDVQSLEQALRMSSANAIAQIYLSPVIITQMRSAVAVIMAVVVAFANHTSVSSAQAPARRIALLSKALNAIAPVVEQGEQKTKQPAQVVEQPVRYAPAQAEQDTGEHEQITPAQLHAVLPTKERVRQALEQATSDREIGRLAGCSAATAKKNRLEIETERQAAVV